MKATALPTEPLKQQYRKKCTVMIIGFLTLKRQRIVAEVYGCVLIVYKKMLITLTLVFVGNKGVHGGEVGKLAKREGYNRLVFKPKEASVVLTATYG